MSNLIGSGLPEKGSLDRARERRTEVLARLEGAVRDLTMAEQQRVFSAAVTRICESRRERELDIVRHEHFGRAEDGERSRDILRKLDAEKDLLSGLHYFLKFFQVDLRTLLAEVLTEAGTHIAMLEQAGASAPTTQ